ncbi:SPOR domain-containing protein [uncultured Tateyamaria sp.]|uniref:SPOR domain-containing protein n=1 Tax=uncultured Tateyamaria sp. TaxID=455651 RepID=UPI00261FD523|nr:SPOR domain-containing protein [uncultured Tateyamaria sp.]
MAIAVIAFGFGTSVSVAQDLSNVQGPAELPPASYRGAQYVDSRGCVFIRAGIDGNINWVPRVNRQRQPICGQVPTLGGPIRTTESDPVRPPATAARAPVAAAPAPAPRPATRPVAAPRQVTTAAPSKPAPAPVVAPRPAPKPAPVRTTASTRPPAPVKSNVSPKTRVLPRHVYDARTARGTFPVPKGYRPVWDDDRLNPRRAEQSLEGIARTRLIWTQTVPRRLLDTATGKDVTTTVALVYPFTDTATQSRDLGTVTLVHRDGQLQKRIVRNKAKAPVPAASTRPTATATAPVKIKAGSTARYVQVGTFGRPANAQAAAQRILRSGLPAKIGQVQRGGKSYQIVLAGPFANGEPLARGLQTSRAAGFRDAFIK